MLVVFKCLELQGLNPSIALSASFDPQKILSLEVIIDVLKSLNWEDLSNFPEKIIKPKQPFKESKRLIKGKLPEIKQKVTLNFSVHK